MLITHFFTFILFPIALTASQACEVRHAVGLVARASRAPVRNISSAQTENYSALSLRKDGSGLSSYQTKQGASINGDPKRRRSIESLNFTNFEINDQKCNAEHKSKINASYSTDDIDNDEIRVEEMDNHNQELQSHPPSIGSEAGIGTPRHSKRHPDNFLQTTNEIDHMEKLNQISLSIERLAEKLSGPLSEQYPDQFNHMDFFIDKNRTPHDFIIDVDSISDDKSRFIPYEKGVFALSTPVSYTRNVDDCDRYYAHDEQFEEFHVRRETSKDYFASRGHSCKVSGAVSDQKAMIEDEIDNDAHVMINNFHDFENSNLRSSVECASEHANGLLLAASRYGIFR